MNVLDLLSCPISKQVNQVLSLYKNCLQQVFIQKIIIRLFNKTMENQYSIKVSYKGNMYIMKGSFPTEDSIKQQIIERKIKDLTGEASFYIEYQEGIRSLQQAYQDCEKNSKNTFKISINKKKSSKNKSNSHKNSQNSSELLGPHLSMIDDMAPDFRNSDPQVSRRSTNLQERNSIPDPESIIVKTVPKKQKPRKNTEQIQLQNQISGQEPVSEFQVKDYEDSCGDFSNQRDLLPNFQVSQIFQKSPLQPEHKQAPRRELPEINPIPNILKQPTLSTEINFTQSLGSNQSSQKCNSCHQNNLLTQKICSGCLQANQHKAFEKMSKSLEESIKLRIKEEVEFDLTTKINVIRNQFKRQLSELRLKVGEQQQHIKSLSKENKELKQALRYEEGRSKMFENQISKIKVQFQNYGQTMKVFQKDFQTINQINFQLQNSKLVLQHKISQLAEKQQKQFENINPKYFIKNKEKENPQAHQPKQAIMVQNKPEKEPLERKAPNQMPKEQLQKIFMNPKFERDEEQKDEGNKNLKAIDGTIKAIDQVSILKVGETYQPQIWIKNTGTSKWPADVYIFEKDTKRTKKLPSLAPKEEHIYKDEVVQKAERESQNIQIKYQVYYEEKGEKMYIGLPISMFIKVKKAESESILAQLQEEMEEMRQIRQSSDKRIIGDKQRLQSSGYGRQMMEEVQRDVNSYQKQALIRMINKCKQELGVSTQTTKDIMMRLKEIDIDETNFETCDKEVIEDLISSYEMMKQLEE